MCVRRKDYSIYCNSHISPLPSLPIYPSSRFAGVTERFRKGGGGAKDNGHLNIAEGAMEVERKSGQTPSLSSQGMEEYGVDAASSPIMELQPLTLCMRYFLN